MMDSVCLTSLSPSIPQTAQRGEIEDGAKAAAQSGHRRRARVHEEEGADRVDIRAHIGQRDVGGGRRSGSCQSGSQ